MSEHGVKVYWGIGAHPQNYILKLLVNDLVCMLLLRNHETTPHTDKLSGYLHDGLLEIDNNLAENTIFHWHWGKNYLFAGLPQSVP